MPAESREGVGFVQLVPEAPAGTSSARVKDVDSELEQGKDDPPTVDSRGKKRARGSTEPGSRPTPLKEKTILKQLDEYKKSHKLAVGDANTMIRHIHKDKKWKWANNSPQLEPLEKALEDVQKLDSFGTDLLSLDSKTLKCTYGAKTEVIQNRKNTIRIRSARTSSKFEQILSVPLLRS
jgi:hypothetical protein